MNAGITLAHHRANVLDSGSSSRFQALSNVFNLRRWNRLRTSAFSISFCDWMLLRVSRLSTDLIDLFELLLVKDWLIVGAPLPPIDGTAGTTSASCVVWRRNFSFVEASGLKLKMASSAFEGVASGFSQAEGTQERVVNALLKTLVLLCSSAHVLFTLLSVNFRAPDRPFGKAVTLSPPRNRSLSRSLRMPESSGRTSCSNQDMRGCCSPPLPWAAPGCLRKLVARSGSGGPSSSTHSEFSFSEGSP
mmetsp:Transcript_86673/g.253683  ORF Transcript_86673/g.253683 Transcript_86673/m.253683 type:complete len:247 (+) Transcript_86673:1183-1923(+)